MSPTTDRIRKLCALVALCAPALAQPAGADRGGIHQRYLEERARCPAGPAEERRTCLREAGAAQIEARRGRLAIENADFERNRFARCGLHRDPAERGYCERRMRGEGRVSGSIEGGGLLRELTVTVPAQEGPPRQ